MDVYYGAEELERFKKKTEAAVLFGVYWKIAVFFACYWLARYVLHIINEPLVSPQVTIPILVVGLTVCVVMLKLVVRRNS